MKAENTSLPECYRKFLSAAERTGILEPARLVALRPWMIHQATSLRRMLESRAGDEFRDDAWSAMIDVDRENTSGDSGNG
ncbi:MAG: hypothetical protein Q4C47_07165, partial [Planctomycetia bacterium]|nr:hypothetical protein [Planctomycetia bacterium]